MTINAPKISALVSAIFATLATETDEPEDGMVVLANLIAFMYIQCNDGSTPLASILAKLSARVTEVVTANEAANKPTGDTLQ
jgi:hypothetical protein